MKEFIVPVGDKGNMNMIENELHLQQLVRCKDCRFLIDHYGFMDDGYCSNMKNKHNIKFKPDRNWFCPDGREK